MLLERAGRLAQGAGGIDQVVDQHALAALDIADDVHHLRDVGARAALVDDGQIRVVQALGQGPGAHHAAHVRRHHHQIGVLVAPDIAKQDRRGIHIVHRDVEESLNLVGVQIHRHHPVGADLADHVGHHLGGDRHPRRARPPVLAGIAEIGHHGGDARGRGAAQRIDHDQQFHQVVVGRLAGRLHDEDVLAADVLHDLDHHLAVAELADHRLAQRNAQMIDDVLRQLRIGIAGEDHHAAVVGHPACASVVCSDHPVN